MRQSGDSAKRLLALINRSHASCGKEQESERKIPPVSRVQNLVGDTGASAGSSSAKRRKTGKKVEVPPLPRPGGAALASSGVRKTLRKQGPVREPGVHEWQGQRPDPARATHLLLNPSVQCEAFTQRPDADKAKTAQFAEPWSPLSELLRLKYASRLRSLLVRLCRSYGREPPLLAFERWQCRRKLEEQKHRSSSSGVANDTRWEPLLPSIDTIDEGLVQDLVRGKLSKAQAQRVATEIACTSARLARKLAEHEREQKTSGTVDVVDDEVTIQARGNDLTSTVVVALGHRKPYLQISLQHYRKLQELHRLWLTAYSVADSDNGSIPSLGREDSVFKRHLWCLLARYEGLRGHGYQAALPGKAFDVLLDELDVSGECFASPLNTRYCGFCSAFPDVDGFFGSQGSFFNFAPSSGSFEVNPPFVPELMLYAVEHMEHLLRQAVGALSFVVIVPQWKSVPAWKRLQHSKWKRHGVEISKDSHR
eukprot:scaffold2157_cov376-Prasinococcus_capsulatus_cf.AAC.19